MSDVRRVPETAALQSWRKASGIAVSHAKYVVSTMEEFLCMGGPDAIRGLRATVTRLEGSMAELKGTSKVQRYTQLQAQLQESDKVKAALAAMLTQSFGVDEAALQRHLKQTVFKEERLYGASRAVETVCSCWGPCTEAASSPCPAPTRLRPPYRELLLRENKLLRAQLEQRHITEKTSWELAAGQGLPRGAASPDHNASKDQDGGAVLASAAVGRNSSSSRAGGSRLAKAKMAAPAQVQALEQLMEAADALEQAERGYRLPSVANAAAQADDGSLKTMAILQTQVTELAGQKSNLLAKVADLQQDLVLVGRRLEQALDEAADQRRQRMELLTHREELSKDIRTALESEAKRADAAELSLGEVQARAQRQAQELALQREQLGEAGAQLAALEAALTEKMNQLEEVRGLYQQLYHGLEKLGGHHEDMGQAVMNTVHKHHMEQAAAVKEARDAAQESARLAATVADLQKRLQEEVASHKVTAGATLAALEGELQKTHMALEGAHRERRHEGRKATAALLLSRTEDRRHERTIKALATDMPAAVADNLAGPLSGIQRQVDEISSDLALANRQISYVAEGGAAAPQQQPGIRDLQDDETAALLGRSRKLRAQLQALAVADPAGPLPHLLLQAACQKQQQQSLRQMQPEEVEAAVGAAFLEEAHQQVGLPEQLPGSCFQPGSLGRVGSCVLEEIKERVQQQQERHVGLVSAGSSALQAPPEDGGAVAVAVGDVVVEALEALEGQHQRQRQPLPIGMAGAIGSAFLGELRRQGHGQAPDELPGSCHLLQQQQQEEAQAAAVGDAALEALRAMRKPAQLYGGFEGRPGVSAAVGAAVIAAPAAASRAMAAAAATSAAAQWWQQP